MMDHSDSEPGHSSEQSPYRRFKQERDDRTDWAIIGPRGAVHFWKFNNISHNCGGVEEHRKEPADYQAGEPPREENCFILGCPCWHDGSSLYADKFFPILELQGEEAIFIQLQIEYKNRFDDRTEEPKSETASMISKITETDKDIGLDE